MKNTTEKILTNLSFILLIFLSFAAICLKDYSSQCRDDKEYGVVCMSFFCAEAEKDLCNAVVCLFMDLIISSASFSAVRNIAYASDEFRFKINFPQMHDLIVFSLFLFPILVNQYRIG